MSSAAAASATAPTPHRAGGSGTTCSGCKTSLSKLYLIGYNLSLSIGWSYLLYLISSFYFCPRTVKSLPNHPFRADVSLYETVKWTLFVCQNAAVLEIVHAALGMVKSSVLLTAVQIASRVIVVCGVLLISEASRTSIGLPLAITAWTLTEIIRYTYYTLSLSTRVPHFIIWLRYSTFIVLYPIGITGELICIYWAQNELARTHRLTITLMDIQLRYQYYLWAVMFLYIPFFPRLYFHMLAQRKKILGTDSKKSKKRP